MEVVWATEDSATADLEESEVESEESEVESEDTGDTMDSSDKVTNLTRCCKGRLTHHLRRYAS